MKEEWKVYIKGVPDRGNEVIKMLEDLGAKNSFDYDGNKLVYLYYIWHDGSIHVELIDNEYGQMIIDNYHEIKLPKQWKDGDILYKETNKEFAVVKYKCKFDSDVVVTYFVTCYGAYLTNKGIYTGNFRLATKSEITQFYERLHAIGKDWDAENKKLVNWKWKPAVGDEYWVVTTDGVAGHLTWNNDPADIRLFNFGNCFRTSNDAEIAIEKIKHLLKEE